MKTVIDGEWIVQWLDNGKVDGSPFNPLNELVSVGWKQFGPIGETEIAYEFFCHNEGANPERKDILQQALDNTTLLIGHNIKGDLMWLHESGFRYDKEVFDTMAVEYVLARGIHTDLSLDACCKRRGTSLKKGELVAEYWAKKIGYEALPKEVVEEYGRQDVQSTYELYLKQLELLELPQNIGLKPTLQMHNEFLLMLEDTERNGTYINTANLSLVESDYLREKRELVYSISKSISFFMGDFPYNINSPEQLSSIIYSRKVIDKKLWADTFNIGLDERGKPLKRPRMDAKELRKNINANTLVLRRTVANQCRNCSGTGRIHKLTKSGQAYKNLPKCQECGGCGILYVATNKIAGLGLGPRSIKDLSSGGFSTDHETLDYLASLPNVSQQAKDLLTKLVRLNAVETYLSTFVNGIRNNTRANKLLHTTFNQCVTSTGRLSSSNPNAQNMPRGNTFPVKRCMRSRFKGGQIAEVDFAQLEFRIAADLSRCPVMFEEILSGQDVHAYTAKVLTDAGQPTTRQDAKAKTFRPLYGGQSGTPAEMTYNKAFMAKYTGLSEWHDKLLDTACAKYKIIQPTGREYLFPLAKRNFYGYVTSSTQIKNFPVQGMATAEIVPLACISLWRMMNGLNLKSLIINTVHDSIIVDIYPGELELVSELMTKACLGVKEEVMKRYNYEIKIPLGIEIKVGHSWGTVKDYLKVDQVNGG